VPAVRYALNGAAQWKVCAYQGGDEMKDKHYGPCEDFDMKTDYAKKGAKCYQRPACFWYMENATPEEMKEDPQAPCKRKLLLEDTDTIDMFEKERQ
jgi:hypothetical protein